MAAKAGTKTFSLTMDARLWDAVDGVVALRKTTRPTVIGEALTAFFEVLPRLERAAVAVDAAYGDRQAIALIADTVVEGLEAIKESEAAVREELEEAQAEIEELRMELHRYRAMLEDDVVEA
ncbi:hypothetical protein GFM44_23060 [Rhizobium leguminosarum bv. viciae]|nr:hypothetical protein [Rhizobium leguminosarum bv. viciae]